MYNENFWLSFNVYTKHTKIYLIHKMLLKLNLHKEKQNKTVFLESCSVVIFIYNNGMLLILHSVIKWQYSDTENQVWQLSTKH